MRDRLLDVSHPAETDACVDLGAGTGFVTLPLARVTSSILAVDISPAMAESLAAHATEEGLSNVQTRVSDLRTFQMPPECVDLVVSSYALHHLRDPDKRTVAAEAARWLRPGGRIVIADMMFGRGASQRDREILRQKAAVLAAKGPGGWWRIAKNLGRYGLRVGQEHPSTPQFWQQALRDAGFTDVRFEPVVAEAGIVSGIRPAKAALGELALNSCPICETSLISIQDSFSMAGMSEVYMHGHHESVLRSHRWRTAENSAAYLLPHITPSATILDIGCGPGTITADLADRVPRGHVTGIDAAPEIIAQARELAVRRANLEFAAANVYALDFPDDSFDVVHAHQVLQHLGDPVRALREMRRVTRPGGLVAARDADFGGMTWYPRLPLLDEWRTRYKRVARGNGGEPDGGRQLHVWARKAGLTDIVKSSSTWTYATERERAWWGGLWADRTVGSAFAASATAGGHATPGDLARIADGWRAWAADEDGWFLVPHGEVLCRVR